MPADNISSVFAPALAMSPVAENASGWLARNGTAGAYSAEGAAGEAGVKEGARGAGVGGSMSQDPLLKHPTGYMVLFCLAYFLVFILAVVNNSLVVTVIYRNPQMRTVTNYFLVNLAVADIMVSFIVLPMTLLSILFREWLFSEFLCKTVPYVQAVVVSASVNTLAAVALERYFAIFFPHKTMIQPRTAFIMIAVIWILPMCIQMPWIFNYILRFHPTTEGPLLICYLKFEDPGIERAFFLGVVFLTCYLIPLCFLSIFYTMIGIKVWQRGVRGIRGSKTERNIQRSKIRIVRMLVTVAAVFALLWLPLYSIRMALYFGSRMEGRTRTIVMNVILPIAQWMGSANSCVNPFIYCFFSEQFRKGMLGTLKSISSCCRK